LRIRVFWPGLSRIRIRVKGLGSETLVLLYLNFDTQRNKKKITSDILRFRWTYEIPSSDLEKQENYWRNITRYHTLLKLKHMSKYGNITVNRSDLLCISVFHQSVFFCFLVLWGGEVVSFYMISNILFRIIDYLFTFSSIKLVTKILVEIIIIQYHYILVTFYNITWSWGLDMRVKNKFLKRNLGLLFVGICIKLI